MKLGGGLADGCRRFVERSAAAAGAAEPVRRLAARDPALAFMQFRRDDAALERDTPTAAAPEGTLMIVVTMKDATERAFQPLDVLLWDCATQRRCNGVSSGAERVCRSPAYLATTGK